MRYEQLLHLAAIKQPKKIVEVGVWNGQRAIELLSACPKAEYFGFDLFDMADATTDAEEKNVKRHFTVDEVRAEIRRQLPEAVFTLCRGNTRETLPRFAKHLAPIDFVWLDGGHSVETIRSDWEALRPHLAEGATVLFDDYYTGGIDTDQFGCNEIVKDLDHVVLPKADKVAGGGSTQIVRVRV